MAMSYYEFSTGELVIIIGWTAMGILLSCGSAVCYNYCRKRCKASEDETRERLVQLEATAVLKRLL